MVENFNRTGMKNLPIEFQNRIRAEWPNEANDFLQAIQNEPATSIRLNSKKPFRFSSGGPKNIPYCSSGYFLGERPIFTLDPHFHAGAYYVQEASSMFLSHALKHCSFENDAPKVLDLSAAPGGKSTLLASELPEEALLVSNEPIYKRAQILKENLTKWGKSNVVVTSGYAHDFKPFSQYFDLVVVDAPCSGEGMFRKDSVAIEEWSEANVEQCAVRQQEILKDVEPLIKHGGYLIYSTCTFNFKENEAQIEALIHSGKFKEIELPIEADWGITRTTLGYRFHPHKVRSEGFYLALLQKIEDDELIAGPPEKKNKKKKNTSTLFKALKPEESKQVQWLENEEFSNLSWFNDTILHISQEARHFVALNRNLQIIKAGVKLGKLLKNKLLPEYDWALCYDLNQNLPKVELTKVNALKYLKREPFEAASYKGWCVATFEGNALGWMNGLGNRFNNGFPKEYAIKMNIPYDEI